jgi:hypothetical protein
VRSHGQKKPGAYGSRFNSRVGKEWPVRKAAKNTEDTWLFHLSTFRILCREDEAKLRRIRDPVRQVRDLIVWAGELTGEIRRKNSVRQTALTRGRSIIYVWKMGVEQRDCRNPRDHPRQNQQT